MDPDQDLCLCFHVKRRKIEKFIQHQKPKRPSQISECYGAGTGCGWCRPFLEKLWQKAQPDSQSTEDLPTAQQYAQERLKYLNEKNKDS